MVTMVPLVTWVTSPGTLTSISCTMTSVRASVTSQCHQTSPRSLTTTLWHLLNTFFSNRLTFNGTFFWLPWKLSGCHGNIKSWQQFSSHPMPLLHSLLGVLWTLGRFFGCHSNGCQGNQSLDIFQPLWPKGPPDRVINTWDIRRPTFALYYIN